MNSINTFARLSLIKNLENLSAHLGILSRNLPVVLLFWAILFGYEGDARATTCSQLFQNSPKFVESDIADKVVAVHLTNFFPTDGIVKASSANTGRFGATIHFALGQPVIDHAFGKWSERKYGVVTPLRNLEPQLLNLLPQDSFVLGDLRLSKDAVIFAPDGDPIPPVPVRIIRYDSTQKKLKETIDTYIKESGSMVFASEGSFYDSALSINGKKIDPKEGLRSLFQKVHQRNPNLTSTTHDYTLWGFVDYTIIDLMANWYKTGTANVVADSRLLLDIIGIEAAIPEIIRVALERSLPSEATVNFKTTLMNLRFYLHFLKVEWAFRKDHHKTILGTDFKMDQALHKQIISAIENPETLDPLLVNNLKSLTSISNASSFKIPTLEPAALLGMTRYSTMEQYQALIREFAPFIQKDSPKKYHSALTKKAFQLLSDNRISYEAFKEYFSIHFFQLDAFTKEMMISDFLTSSFSQWPKIPESVAIFFRSPEVQQIINEREYFEVYNKSAREIMTMNYLFKAILKPTDLEYVRAEGRIGVWYNDKSGRMWYLKKDELHSELQTAAEVISSAILARFGYKVPYVQIVHLNGVRYAAVEALQRGKVSMTLADVGEENVKPLRVFSALLKDWDRVSSYNNFIYTTGRDKFAMF